MKAVLSILKADASLIALLPDGAESIFSTFAVQEKSRPYVVVLSSVDDPHTTGTGQNLDELSVRVWSVSNKEYTTGSEIGSREVSDEIRTALHGFKGTSAGQVVDINYESDGIVRVSNTNKPSVEIEQVYQVFNTK